MCFSYTFANPILRHISAHMAEILKISLSIYFSNNIVILASSALTTLFLFLTNFNSSNEQYFISLQSVMYYY